MRSSRTAPWSRPSSASSAAGPCSGRAPTEAGLTLTPAYSVDAVAEPGSTLIDSTVTGPNRAVVDRLAAGYGRAATSYVSASYSAYVLERLSTAPGGDGTRRRDVQVVILALLVGSALGVALVAGELLVEPRLRRFFARSPAAESGGTTGNEPAEERRTIAP